MADNHTLRLKKEVKSYLQETFTARFHCEVTRYKAFTNRLKILPCPSPCNIAFAMHAINALHFNCMALSILNWQTDSGWRVVERPFVYLHCIAD
jgi:hypothetical protein